MVNLSFSGPSLVAAALKGQKSTFERPNWQPSSRPKNFFDNLVH